MDILAMDGDGHVEEWEATWSDDYLEPEFRDRRPRVVETGEFEHDYIWDIAGERIRIGGSPSSKDGVVSTEYEKMAKWRGPHESGEFHSAEARLAVMDAENTYLSVNYPTLLLSWPIASDPALNAALTRSYNSWVADVSNQSPDRLKWVTAIDPRDPAEAVREMERTKKMGSVGVMVFGDYSDKALDDPSLECFWAAAQDLEMPVNVHPGTGARDAMKTYRNIAGDQFLMSVVRGFKTICGSGILDRYPKVKVSFLETGCTWVDFAVAVMDFTLDNVKDRLELGTIRSEHKAIVERGLPEATPLEYIRDGRIFIGFEVDDDLLPYMVNKYGTDCWVYASDIPHAHRVPDSPRYISDRPDLSDEQKSRILWKGTTELYSLPVPAGAGISG
ncbi:MAG: amidohydrolase family protein [Chloroflexi bacterium]|nr:amidohydrolase family protein [Chloroflexota bacterium]MYK33546.1 amidohydrolase family protein [Chloroflexota bacterium]